MWAWITISFLVIFASVLLTVSLAWGWMQARRNARLAAKVQSPTGREQTPKSALLHAPAADEALPLKMLGKPAYDAIRTMLDQSGTTLTPGTFLFLTLALAATGVLISLAIPPLGPRGLPTVILGVGLGVLPYLWLALARKKRFDEFEEQFPDALDFLARAMRAGHAFSVGLELLPQESSGPVSQEFRRLYQEQNLGAPLETALKNLAVRMPSVDVKFFVAAVLVQRETGGNLSEILLQLSGVIRERFELKGQVRAASAHGRLTGAVLSILPILLVFGLLVVAPGYLEGMAKDDTGKYMIGAAILFQFIGFFFIRRIVHIKV
jgi:tight adherence protein B